MRPFIVTLLAGALTLTGFTQNAANSQRGVVKPPSAATELAEDLPRFDLAFPGGTPQELVDAIQKEITILNAIIPAEHKNVKLPPMKMKSVNVKELFDALEAATRKTVPYETGRSGDGRRIINEKVTSMGFQTTPPVRRESVWAFYVIPAFSVPEQRIVKYYQLKGLLGEYKIEDITTAIQAGWKMMGEGENAELNYHEDTKLLIGAGASYQLDVIASVLAQLREAMMTASPGSVDPATGSPVPPKSR